jgi:molybdenum cofactor biosynthesis protein B
MSTDAHRATAPDCVRCVVLVISDTRTLDTDTGGRAIAELLTAAGHLVVDRRVLKDDPAPVADLVRELAASGIADAVITTGGTGITHRDSTFEAIDGLLDKRLPGFGELFRMLSFEQVGAAAMLSRACAGTCGRLIVLALPGSEKAVRLAMTRLILPELGHLVSEIRR